MVTKEWPASRQLLINLLIWKFLEVFFFLKSSTTWNWVALIEGQACVDACSDKLLHNKLKAALDILYLSTFHSLKNFSSKQQATHEPSKFPITGTKKLSNFLKIYYLCRSAEMAKRKCLINWWRIIFGEKEASRDSVNLNSKTKLKRWKQIHETTRINIVRLSEDACDCQGEINLKETSPRDASWSPITP